MQENPKCPKCKNNRRVISSHKRAVFTPGPFKKSTIFFFKKIVEFSAWVLNKAMAVINFLHRTKYIFKCNACKKDFKGTQKKKR